MSVPPTSVVGTSKRYRLNLLVLVDAEDDKAAGDIAVAIYERFAKPMLEVDGVFALFPVADIKPDPFAGQREEEDG